METVTVRAVYKKGVLRPVKKLNLPENSVVEIRVRSTRVSKQTTPFASLIGVWEHLPEKEKSELDKSLLRARRSSASKIRKLAKSLK